LLSLGNKRAQKLPAGAAAGDVAKGGAWTSDVGRSARPTRGVRRWLRVNGFYVAMLAPLLVIMALLYAYPVARTVYTSFTNLNFLSGSPAKWVGLANYGDYVGSSTGVAALRNTFVFTLVATTLETLLGLGLALLLNRLIRGKGLVRTLLLLPMMFAPVVAGYEWRWIFDDQVGVANFLLQKVGIIDHPVAWLSSTHLAFWTIVAADIWYSTPFLMIIVLGGLQSLPQEPFEAARVDGAGPFRTLWHITLPLLAPVLLAAVLIRAMDAFQVFDLPFIMTYGGPGHATETVNTLTYKTAFHDFQMGGASAISMVALLAMLLVGAFLARIVFRQLGVRGEK
jgi:multiple sugar transport system permease protein